MRAYDYRGDASASYKARARSRPRQRRLSLGQAFRDWPGGARRVAPPPFARLRCLSRPGALRAPDAGRRAGRARLGKPSRRGSGPAVSPAACRPRSRYSLRQSGSGCRRSHSRRGRRRSARRACQRPVRHPVRGLPPRQGETRTGQQNKKAPRAPPGRRQAQSDKSVRAGEEMLRHRAAPARVTRGAAARVRSNIADITRLLARAGTTKRPSRMAGPAVRIRPAARRRNDSFRYPAYSSS